MRFLTLKFLVLSFSINMNTRTIVNISADILK